MEMSRCRLNGVTLMPHTLTTVAFERAGMQEGECDDAAHRDRAAQPVGDLQQKYLPAMQWLAARA